MKTAIMAAIVAIGAMVTFAQAPGNTAKPAEAKMSLADARGQIDKAIVDRALLKRLMKGLSAEDQKQFLSELNKAVADMPASPEERAATYLNVNSTAVRSAVPGNVSTLIAEVYATASPEALTIINERFAIDLINRAADPKVKYTDQQFLEISTNLMAKVIERCEETDNGSPRAGFAIVMLVRASNGTPANLAETLISMLKHADARELATNEWIPAALGLDGRTQTYEPLLASADAGRRPDIDFVLVIAGPQYHDAVLADIFGKNTDPMSFSDSSTPVLDAVENPLIMQNPVFGGDLPGAAGAAGGAAAVSQRGGGENEHGKPEDVDKKEEDEPGGYRGQTPGGF